MIFRQCSIGGKVYTNDPTKSRPHASTNPISSDPTSNIETIAEASPSDTAPLPLPSLDSTAVDDDTRFYSSELAADLQEALQADAQSENASQARALNGFLTVLSLCHTVLTSLNPNTGKIEYKAQSPDEAALVQAAADVGYVFKGKDRDVLTLEKPGLDEGHPIQERYELLNILEFNSTRKRMSVVMRKLDEDGHNRIFLLSKGADNVIFERLKKGVDQALKDQTELHLSEFANNGLRTLTLGFKVIPGEHQF
jgi:phospholipid-translocating ATPase